MPVKYGLTRDGFRRKRLPEIIQGLNDRVADKLGVAIQTGSTSVFGNIHGVYAYELAYLWEQAEAVYNAMYPNTADGSSLSNAAALAGISLITAEQSTMVVTCYGTDNTKIPYGAQIASRLDSTLVFRCTDTDGYISSSKASYVSITMPAPVAGTVYTLTIDGTARTYTAVDGSTATTVLIGLSSQFSVTDRTLSVTNGTLTIKMADPTDTMTITVSNLNISAIGSPINFKSETYGAIDPSIGTVDQIITTYAGWSGASNEAAASVGRDAETDTSLRQRWSASVYARGAAMTDAIQAAIFSNVDGVTAAKVFENNGDITDSEGRPPHSIEAVVYGGDEAAIAEQIWKRKSAGIDTFGSIANTVYDSQGITHTINFNRPTEIKVWLKIVVGRNPDETMAASVLSDIMDAVANKGSTQEIGQDVILQRYFSTIFSATPGIGYISITACTGDTAGTYTADNIAISSRQIAVIEKSRIEVSKQ